MQVSYNKLQELTGFSYRTVRNRLFGLKPAGKGRIGNLEWDSKEALPLLYGKNGSSLADDSEENDKLDFSSQKARLAKEQADGQVLKNAMQRRELIPASEVAETWGRIITAAKMQFLALPDRLAQMLETASTANARRIIIEVEIKNILEALADGK